MIVFYTCKRTQHSFRKNDTLIRRLMYEEFQRQMQSGHQLKDG